MEKTIILNKQKSKELSFNFENLDDWLYQLKDKLEWFKFHNKNLTKTQDHIIETIEDIISCVDIQ